MASIETSNSGKSHKSHLNTEPGSTSVLPTTRSSRDHEVKDWSKVNPCVFPSNYEELRPKNLEDMEQWMEKTKRRLRCRLVYTRDRALNFDHQKSPGASLDGERQDGDKMVTKPQPEAKVNAKTKVQRSRADVEKMDQQKLVIKKTWEKWALETGPGGEIESGEKLAEMAYKLGKENRKLHDMHIRLATKKNRDAYLIAEKCWEDFHFYQMEWARRGVRINDEPALGTKTRNDDQNYAVWRNYIIDLFDEFGIGSQERMPDRLGPEDAHRYPIDVRHITSAVRGYEHQVARLQHLKNKFPHTTKQINIDHEAFREAQKKMMEERTKAQKKMIEAQSEAEEKPEAKESDQHLYHEALGAFPQISYIPAHRTTAKNGEEHLRLIEDGCRSEALADDQSDVNHNEQDSGSGNDPSSTKNLPIPPSDVPPPERSQDSISQSDDEGDLFKKTYEECWRKRMAKAQSNTNDAQDGKGKGDANDPESPKDKYGNNYDESDDSDQGPPPEGGNSVVRTTPPPVVAQGPGRKSKSQAGSESIDPPPPANKSNKRGRKAAATRTGNQADKVKIPAREAEQWEAIIFEESIQDRIKTLGFTKFLEASNPKANQGDKYIKELTEKINEGGENLGKPERSEVTIKNRVNTVKKNTKVLLSLKVKEGITHQNIFVLLWKYRKQIKAVLDKEKEDAKAEKEKQAQQKMFGAGHKRKKDEDEDDASNSGKGKKSQRRR